MTQAVFFFVIFFFGSQLHLASFVCFVSYFLEFPDMLFFTYMPVFACQQVFLVLCLPFVMKLPGAVVLFVYCLRMIVLTP